MAGNAKVSVSITGDNRSLQRATTASERDLGHLATSGKKSMDRLKLAAVGAAGALGVGLTKGLIDSFKAANEAETSQAKLQAQLKASGISYKDHAKEIDNVIQKTARLAAVDDEDLQDAFTNIVRATGSVKKSLGLVSLATDLARAKHMDLAKAGDLVGKVANGNVNILKRYGVAVDPVTTAQDKLAKSTKNATTEQKSAAKAADATATTQRALAAAQAKFAGQGERYGKTTSGAIDRAKNAVENLEESIGGALAPTIKDAADKAAKFIDQIRTGTGAGGKFRDTLQEIVDKVKPIAKFFTDHPKLIAVAVGAWAVYKAASIAAIAVINVKRFRTAFFKSVPAAGEAGTAAGTAYTAGYEATAATGLAKTTRTGKVASHLKTAGKALGTVTGVLIATELAQAYKGFFDKPENSLDTFVTEQQQRIQSALGKGGNIFGEVQTGVHSGGQTAAHNQQADRSKPNVSAKTSSVKAHTSMVAPHDPGSKRTSSSGKPTPPVRRESGSSSPKSAGGRGSLSLASYISSRFGLRLSSSYRTPEHNAAVGGVPGSWHTRGSAANPGAIDLVGSGAAMSAALAWAQSNVPGLAEAMIHNVGSGLHLHLAGNGIMSWNGGSVGGSTSGGGGGAVSTGGGASTGASFGSGGTSASPAAPTKLDRLTASSDLAALTSGKGDDRKAANRLVTYWQNRLKAARAKGNPTAVSTAAQGLKSARDAVAELKPSKPSMQPQWDIEAANADIAEAQGHTDVATLIRVVSQRKQLAVVNQKLHRKGLTPAQIAALTQQKASLVQGITSAQDAYGSSLPQPGDTPSQDDIFGAQLSLAGLSGGDTTGILQQQLAYHQKRLQYAQAVAATGNPDALITAGQEADTVKQLIDALNANTDAVKDAQADLATELKRQNDFNQAISGAMSMQILKGITDIVSGQIGGALGLGFQTPSFAPGNGVRYG